MFWFICHIIFNLSLRPSPSRRGRSKAHLPPPLLSQSSGEQSSFTGCPRKKVPLWKFLWRNPYDHFRPFGYFGQFRTMNNFGPNRTIIYHMSTITMVLNCYIDSFQKFYECTFFWDTMWNHNFMKSLAINRVWRPYLKIGRIQICWIRSKRKRFPGSLEGNNKCFSIALVASSYHNKLQNYSWPKGRQNYLNSLDGFFTRHNDNK